METDGKALIPPARDAPDDLEAVLSPWEKKYTEWMVEKRPAQVSFPKQARMCSKAAGHEVSVADVKKLRARRAYRRYYTALAALEKEKSDEARVIWNDSLPEAASLHRRAMASLAKAQDGQIDVRAVPALTVPLLERSWPKKIEQEVRSTVVTINISATQQSGLDEPPIDVEAEEISSEIIP